MARGTHRGTLVFPLLASVFFALNLVIDFRGDAKPLSIVASVLGLLSAAAWFYFAVRATDKGGPSRNG